MENPASRNSVVNAVRSRGTSVADDSDANMRKSNAHDAPDAIQQGTVMQEMGNFALEEAPCLVYL